MCGCNSIGGGAAAYANYAPAASSPPVAPTVGGGPALGAPLQLPTQINPTDPSVRNEQLAARSIERLKAATAHLQTEDQARAAGYHPNPSAPDHWINDQIFATRNGYDVDKPATIMFENDKLIGVMLSHNPNLGLPPDLGAGSWHTHGGTSGQEYALHVRLDRPVQDAYGKEQGDV